jgi:hypothetical protein
MAEKPSSDARIELNSPFNQSFELIVSEDRPSDIPRESSFYQQSGSR